jgi:2-oxoacid:acceptor oxidoreductase delta subunit (pyruvate/2-ketoisovalerate family)
VSGDCVHGVPQLSVSSTTTRINKTGSWKYIRPIYRDRVAPCNEGCPTGIDIEAYMDLLRRGRVEEAIDLLLRENPLPATTGRVCYHPCENACNRRSLDGAVSIRCVERALGDRALKAAPPARAKRTHKESVAVIGSGPAGLACAYHLAGLGYGVTVFESAGEPGGVLRLGIPEYRLPREVLDGEIARIQARGVEIKCGVRVGESMAWEDLKPFDAVFLAGGAHRSRPLGIQGEENGAVRPGLPFLRLVNSGERPNLGRRAVILGGGNTAMDCARTALRLGARPLVLYRRTRAEMPAIDEEVAEAAREGVSFEFLAAPVKVRERAGRLQGLECVRMRLGDVDDSGRRRPVPVAGSEFFVPADTVLTAIGEEVNPEDLPASFRNDGRVEVDEFGSTGVPRFFAGGDAAGQTRTVAHALGSGKRAAIGIDRFLRGESPTPESGRNHDDLRYGRLGNMSITRWRGDDPVHRRGAVNEVVPFEILNTNHFVPVPRHDEGELSPEESCRGFYEVHLGLDGERALREAGRCLNCGVCNQCELCLIFCPDVAISRSADGKGFDIDYDYCKGCGLCSAECPRGAMAMTREGL